MKDDVISLLKSIGTKIKKDRHFLTKDGTKIGSQLKTEADKLSHRLLVENLKVIKNIPIISEEEKNSHKIKKNSYWMIDPIDGTSSLAEGYLGWVIQVALIEDNKVYFSAVHSPDLELTYYAILNEGAYLNEKRIKVSKSSTKRVLIDNYPKPKGIAKKIFDSLEFSNYVESGSIGLKICRVAEGSANLFVKDVVVRDWDILPPLLILSEAGGHLRKLDGTVYSLSEGIEKNGIIAASDYNYIPKVIELTED